MTWTPLPDVAEYWVYGASNQQWFVPGLAPGFEHRVASVIAPTTSWSSSDGVGEPAANWTYLIIAVDESEQELSRSNRAGELDYEAGIPGP